MDCHFILERIMSKALHLPHVSSHLQLADLFTKAKTKSQHDFLTTKLMLRSSPNHMPQMAHKAI